MAELQSKFPSESDFAMNWTDANCKTAEAHTKDKSDWTVRQTLQFHQRQQLFLTDCRADDLVSTYGERMSHEIIAENHLTIQSHINNAGYRHLGPERNKQCSIRRLSDFGDCKARQNEETDKIRVLPSTENKENGSLAQENNYFPDPNYRKNAIRTDENCAPVNGEFPVQEITRHVKTSNQTRYDIQLVLYGPDAAAGDLPSHIT